MDQDEALRLLRGGTDGIDEWNRRRAAREQIPVLDEADLRGHNLSKADLSAVAFYKADLSRVDAKDALFYDANLRRANLECASLCHANFRHANLSQANLTNAHLERAILFEANLADSTLASANLKYAALVATNFRGAHLAMADFTNATMSRTILACDLSDVTGLDTVLHEGSSYLGMNTLSRKLPEAFLRGCGLQPWEVTTAKIHDPDLTALQIADLQAEAFRQRTEGPVFLGGVFIAYGHEDSAFVDKMRDKLNSMAVSVWCDRHDLVAGPLRRQVNDAIRLNDVVLLVLSKHSVHSNWVDYEVKKALQKEVMEERVVLVPVALDNAWYARTKEPGHWRDVRERTVLDFSSWKTKAFDSQLDKLVKGLKIYFEPPFGRRKPRVG